MEGKIIKILSNDYTVLSNNKEYVCKSRGKFRKDNITPLVGDIVMFDEDNKYILDIKKRKNFLNRPSVANIDQAFIITSLKSPDLSLNLLDKLLLVCHINRIEPIICLTKKDLLDKKDKKEITNIIKYYKSLGYKVLYNTDIRKIKKLFKDKTTVFTGQTGAGKSTLINKLDKTLNFETGEISKALGRGKHTTRCTTLVSLYGGSVVDTPGFSDIDLSLYTDDEIKKSFIEFEKFKCPYKDCKHLNEKECEVKKHIGTKILNSRYENYKKFLER